MTDILYFLVNKPKIPTLIKFASAEERDNYNHRIMQRIGIDSQKHSVLNIHKIGVDAPVSFIFNELMQWNGDSTCWPNHMARVDRIENDLEHIQILPFGWKKYPLKIMERIKGFNLIPLFLLTAIRVKKTPDPFDFDNARYLLYECSGGYPIGIYTMYVRSSIPTMGEKSTSQLFIAVSFNFYGNENWQSRRKLVNRFWEMIHNRVTANMMNRIKQLGEWRIEMIKKS